MSQPQNDTSLADPFAKIFVDRAEADWAFDFLVETVKQLEIAGAYDERFVLTLVRQAGKLKLHLSFGGWLVAGPGAAPYRVELTLLAERATWGERLADQTFIRKEGQPEVRSYRLSLQMIRPMTSDLQTAFQTTLVFIADKFRHWKRPPSWQRHNPEIIQALFDPEQRRRVLVGLQCHYQEHTADIADKQILAWTLYSIACGGMYSERVLPRVRRAYRALQGLVTSVPHQPTDCLARPYHRLNEDYQALHALCRFFLEHSGPGHQVGNRTMLPFLVDMASLFERFVAEWLKSHLPISWSLAVQEHIELGQTAPFHFAIDLVLYEARTGAPRCVLDTKYKIADNPAAAGIHQMISYAHTKGCPEAILVYPGRLAQPFDEVIRGIRIRNLTFALGGDLEQAGQAFLHNLGVGNGS